jgi:serine protease Do
MPITSQHPTIQPESHMTARPEGAARKLVSSPGVNQRQQLASPTIHSRRWLNGCLLALGALFTSSVAVAEPVAQAKATAREAQKLAEELVPVAEESPEVKAARGIVVIQRAGQPIGLGTVLAKDGRILTALSNLGAGNDLEAKFADDSVKKLKVGHSDRVWDLALLVPQSGKWGEGLVASSLDPLRDDAEIHAFSGAKGKPAAVPIELRTRRSLIGGDDRLLEQALELGSRVNGKDVGAPLIDEKGRVVGVLGRACLPIEGKPCAPVAYGVPVSAIKSFLKSVPEDAVPPAAWLGIQGASESTSVVKGVRVLSVAKGSPASEAKLKSGEKGEGDLIVGVNGKPVTTPEELAEAVRAHAVGEKIPLTLLSKGKYRTVDVLLKAPPEMAKAVTSKVTAKPKARLAEAEPEAPAAEEDDNSQLTPRDALGLAKKGLSGKKTITISTHPKKSSKSAAAEKPAKPEKPAKAAKPAKPKNAAPPAKPEGSEDQFDDPE